MIPLAREDLIELGASLSSNTRVDWATRQIVATEGRETRLQTRGVSVAYLAGLKDLIGAKGPSKASHPPARG